MGEPVSAKLPPRELISFYIAGQHFCIDIMAVREIRGWTTATSLPHAPRSSRGVVNLRGVILPIVDLGAQLGLSASEPTKQNVIIVVHVHDQSVGLLVDGVNGILTVTQEMVQPAPSIAAGPVSSEVAGLIEVEGRLLTLLHLDTIMSQLTALAA